MILLNVTSSNKGSFMLALNTIDAIDATKQVYCI
jgi:hypothetical protein